MGIPLHEAAQFDRDIAMIGDAAGTEATVRRHVSEAGGAPWLGERRAPTIQERRVRIMTVRPATVQEMQEAGGQLLAGDMIAHIQGDLAARDRVVVEGAEWQVASEPRPQTLYGRRYLTAILRRQGT